MTDELTEARETIRRLNRRVQALEGPWQSKLAAADRKAEMWASCYSHTFNRMLKAHQELKQVYVEAAKATGAPHARFHSVMDGCTGWGDDQNHVFANVFVPTGVHTVRVLDEVKSALAGRRRPWWRRLLGL